VALGRGNPAPIVAALNERWSLDFVHDALASGRRIRALTITDDYSHESLAIEVRRRFPGSA
jgi:putative transposase